MKWISPSFIHLACLLLMEFIILWDNSSQVIKQANSTPQRTLGKKVVPCFLFNVSPKLLLPSFVEFMKLFSVLTMTSKSPILLLISHVAMPWFCFESTVFTFNLNGKVTFPLTKTCMLFTKFEKPLANRYLSWEGWSIPDASC